MKRPGAKSSAKGVKRLKASSFAYPKARKYPINTKARARNALARAAQSGTAGSYATVERKVHAKFPTISTRHHPRKR